ncbi:hypothetical protein BLNAU_8642 [Blattamonas nauphoetae]|uniref:Uncharacterized protein n=1 Tax=Blattamonas nauphoetae TaxID=2049346 RepID=A0ABQ9XY80_9EUKA|nr:hypothetical protein BLNAU_8642 [Blattamonas nauphoetae]
MDEPSYFQNCSFSSCSSDSIDGGAIHSERHPLMIHSCTFKDCSSLHRGGALSFGGSLNNIVLDSSFTNCHSKEEGGAIYVESAHISIIKSSFQTCQSEGSGGCCFSEDSTVFIFETSAVQCGSKETGGFAHISLCKVDISSLSAIDCFSRTTGTAMHFDDGSFIELTTSFFKSDEVEDCLLYIGQGSALTTASCTLHVVNPKHDGSDLKLEGSESYLLNNLDNIKFYSLTKIQHPESNTITSLLFAEFSSQKLYRNAPEYVISESGVDTPTCGYAIPCRQLSYVMDTFAEEIREYECIVKFREAVSLKPTRVHKININLEGATPGFTLLETTSSLFTISQAHFTIKDANLQRGDDPSQPLLICSSQASLTLLYVLLLDSIDTPHPTPFILAEDCIQVSFVYVDLPFTVNRPVLSGSLEYLTLKKLVWKTHTFEVDTSVFSLNGQVTNSVSINIELSSFIDISFSKPLFTISSNLSMNIVNSSFGDMRSNTNSIFEIVCEAFSLYAANTVFSDLQTEQFYFMSIKGPPKNTTELAQVTIAMKKCFVDLCEPKSNTFINLDLHCSTDSVTIEGSSSRSYFPIILHETTQSDLFQSDTALSSYVCSPYLGRDSMLCGGPYDPCQSLSFISTIVPLRKHVDILILDDLTTDTILFSNKECSITGNNSDLFSLTTNESVINTLITLKSSTVTIIKCSFISTVSPRFFSVEKGSALVLDQCTHTHLSIGNEPISNFIFCEDGTKLEIGFLGVELQSPFDSSGIPIEALRTNHVDIHDLNMTAQGILPRGALHIQITQQNIFTLQRVMFVSCLIASAPLISIDAPSGRNVELDFITLMECGRATPDQTPFVSLTIRNQTLSLTGFNAVPLVTNFLTVKATSMLTQDTFTESHNCWQDVDDIVQLESSSRTVENVKLQARNM